MGMQTKKFYLLDNKENNLFSAYKSKDADIRSHESSKCPSLQQLSWTCCLMFSERTLFWVAMID